MIARDWDRQCLWRFRAKPLGNHDGDTATVEADLGYSARHEVHIRLAGFSAPETYEAGGKEATARLTAALAGGEGEWPLRVVSRQRDTIISEVRSFERFVSDCYVIRDGQLVDVVTLLQGVP